jgi:hypothetical protein
MKTQNTAYSILDLALVSKGNTLKDTFNNVRELAQNAETSLRSTLNSKSTSL